MQDALKGQLVAVARKSDGSVFAATQVQTAWAIDALWAYSGPLGVAFESPNVPTVRLWAPTAQAVRLHVADPTKTEVAAVDMTEDASGVWSATGTSGWYGNYYRFEITVYHPATGHIEHLTVTDPYAVNLDTNGLWAQFVDLSDPATKPANWDALAKPALLAPEDIVVYEGHIRDFSALDSTVAVAHQGKYLAFSENGVGGANLSNGMKHLKDLATAGLTHFHLLTGVRLRHGKRRTRRSGWTSASRSRTSARRTPRFPRRRAPSSGPRQSSTRTRATRVTPISSS